MIGRIFWKKNIIGSKFLGKNMIAAYTGEKPD
jgi:hypothetical protein